jgi:CubicO group peptidase (beta-lactamase class C family)
MLYSIVSSDFYRAHTSNQVVASISKLFTTLAILKLIEQGKIALDDPVSKFLRGFSHQTIVVRHLLTHCSGFPPEPSPLLYSLARNTTPQELRSSVISNNPICNPEQTYCYSGK